jgi:hypothetical protein
MPPRAVVWVQVPVRGLWGDALCISLALFRCGYWDGILWKGFLKEDVKVRVGEDSMVVIKVVIVFIFCVAVKLFYGV